MPTEKGIIWDATMRYGIVRGAILKDEVVARLVVGYPLWYETAYKNLLNVAHWHEQNIDIVGVSTTVCFPSRPDAFDKLAGYFLDYGEPQGECEVDAFIRWV